MKREVSIGTQDFAWLRENDKFYIDKSDFIKEWWDGSDAVTLITRPRRFGKTLNMSMLNYFFSNQYENRGDLFEGLNIWKHERFRTLQGTYPVIFLSFAGVKGRTYAETVREIKKQIVKLFSSYSFLNSCDKITAGERTALQAISEEMDDIDAAYSINLLSALLAKYYGKKVLIFLDEYDTPLQEAYVNQFWGELTAFIRTMFNNTFKTNPSMERAIMTGITRVSKESIFSDLNNLYVITTTSDRYATAFGFTQEEVFAAMDEQGLPEDDKEEIRYWYDGFTFGKVTDIYNPWSVTMYLKEGKIDVHWANTSGNGLVGYLLQRSNREIKMDFEKLLKGESIEVPLDEQIIFDQLDKNKNAIWSLLLASGYLKVLNRELYSRARRGRRPLYTLALTNYEVQVMFEELISGWFGEDDSMNGFVRAMFDGNVLDMNRYMNDVALSTFSSFDTGAKPSGKEPERFYHGFVLGLLVENAEDYIIRSNRESGYGRYDVILEPRNKQKTAVIMEFKVLARDEGEQELSDTAQNALTQIEEKRYETELIADGIPKQNILKYGLAFEGKRCLIRKAE